MSPRRSLIGWLLNAPPPRPPTRLTEAEAVALAAAAPHVQAAGRPLPMATVYQVGGRPIWRLSAATVGAQWWVEVDDQTGAVGAVHQSGEF